MNRLRIALLAGLTLLECFGMLPAYAQRSALNSCSQTVSTASAPVSFPASPQGAPTDYLELCNAHASNTLGVNAVGGTAAIGSAGTLTLNPGGCVWWSGLQGPIPAGVAVIGSAAGTTTACWFK